MQDAKLAELAGGLEKLPASVWPLADDALILRLHNRASYKRVYWFGGRWAVRLYMQGRCWFIGWHTNVTIAARFADAASLYFWNYRGWFRKPEDEDFNLNHAQAKIDSQVPEIKTLLIALENYLTEKYKWTPRTPKHDPAGPNVEPALLGKWEATQAIRRLEARVNELTEQLKTLIRIVVKPSDTDGGPSA